MGVLQHHDAVSGTELQPVADDYVKQLARGVARCENVVNEAYARLMPAGSSSRRRAATPLPKQVFCHALNVSECAVTESGNKIAVTLYNPRGQVRTAKVRLPWSGSAFSVLCPK